MTDCGAVGAGPALITGASAGIGEAFARRLAADGVNLILVARRLEPLAALASELTRRYQVKVEVLAADLSAPDGVESVAQQIAALSSLSLLVNNAGTTSDPRESIQVNVTALALLTRAALPGMIERGSGSIVNVASIAAFRTNRTSGPELLMATYAATKAFVVTYCQRLDEEVLGTGVQVQALCPGWTPTEMARPDEFAGIVRSEAWMPADDVVQASLAGLVRGELICVPGLESTHLLDELNRVKDAILNETSTTGTLATRYRTGDSWSAGCPDERAR